MSRIENISTIDLVISNIDYPLTVNVYRRDLDTNIRTNITDLDTYHSIKLQFLKSSSNDPTDLIDQVIHNSGNDVLLDDSNRIHYLMSDEVITNILSAITPNMKFYYLIIVQQESTSLEIPLLKGSITIRNIGLPNLN